MLQSAGHVTAIETDRRRVKLLQEGFWRTRNFNLQHADALKVIRMTDFDWSAPSSLPTCRTRSPRRSHRSRRLGGPAPNHDSHLQLEVVRRMLAGPEAGKYGVLALLIGLHYVTGEWFTIPRGSFYPEPNVDSGCIELLRRRRSCYPQGCAQCLKKSPSVFSPSAKKK
ncbi:MAG: hypothetical protein Ct9H300mP32_1490 [Verrucomicrobiota bacterium]|nr:MAG: hypothetical protein Ct9H300mP32_1490 [Verrucomicrobiota bacterium]